MNIAAAKGQETHVHCHVHPRYVRPITIANELFEDVLWYPQKAKADHIVNEDVLRVIVEKIRDNLD